MIRPLPLPAAPPESPARRAAPSRGAIGPSAPLLLLAFALLLGAYFVARAGPNWGEADTTGQTTAIRAVAGSGQLVPASGGAYPNGYGYAAVSDLLLAFSGLGLPALQRFVYPLLSALLVLPAWALYRELAGSARLAALATLLLLIQPEFLFVALRGSHERVLRALMLASLWLLARSFRLRDRPAHFALHVALFYLVAYGLVATNVLFGISFLAAIATAMGGAWLLGRWRAGPLELAGATAARLASVALALAGLGFLFVFYLYSPARHSLQALDSAIEKLLALLLTTQGGVSPYVQVAEGWSSLWAYFLLSAADYLLILVSAAVWLGFGRRWLRRGERPASLGLWLLWLLYAAFALQGAFAILSDFTGALAGNVQHRAFPSFSIVAVGLVAVAAGRARLPGWGRALGAVVMGALAALAVLKATAEPALSSKWIFAAPEEVAALGWADGHSRYGATWVGPDERLATVYQISFGSPGQGNAWDIYEPDATTRLFLVSEVIRLHAPRRDLPLPAAVRENRVYDNGASQLHRLWPRTPYQR